MMPIANICICSRRVPGNDRSLMVPSKVFSLAQKLPIMKQNAGVYLQKSMPTITISILTFSSPFLFWVQQKVTSLLFLKYTSIHEFVYNSMKHYAYYLHCSAHTLSLILGFSLHMHPVHLL